MSLQNFIYLLFGLVWLSGLIWAGVIAFKNREGHGHSSWQDPKHSAKYIEKEFENRHDALAYRDSLGLQGIVEVYVKEANE